MPSQKDIYTLAIDVAGKDVTGGVGYLVLFSLPHGYDKPEEIPEFLHWKKRVQETVLQAGDLVFNADPRIAKKALAEMFYRLEKIDNFFQIAIESGNSAVPAIQIFSTNPADKTIGVDLYNNNQTFFVTTCKNTAPAGAKITAPGHTRILAPQNPAVLSTFPFIVPPAIRINKGKYFRP